MVTTKRWGWEQEIYRGDYMVKKLHMRHGQHCSWHDHESKHETATVLEGTLAIETREGRQLLRPGMFASLAPGVVHRMLAPFDDCTYLESSTVSDQATRYGAMDCRDFRVAMSGQDGPAFVWQHQRGEPCLVPATLRQTVMDGLRTYGIHELIEGEVSPESPKWEASGDPMEKIGDEERTYVGPKLVVKWFADPTRAAAVYARFSSHPRAPRPRSLNGGWMSYEPVDGRPAVAAEHPQVFSRIDYEGRDDPGWCEWFLVERTIKRLERHRPKLVGEAREWLRREDLLRGSIVSPLWHGDLSPENVIMPTGAYIDLHEAPEGDLHYDAAKWLKGMQFAHSNRKVQPEPDMPTFGPLDRGRVKLLRTVVVLKMAGAHGGQLGDHLEAWARELMKT